MSKADWDYLKYVLRHKWKVVRLRRRVGVGLWRAVWHDMSKFKRDEWVPYREWFYGDDPNAAQGWFAYAAARHIARNKHHWQYWIRRADKVPRVMPKQHVREMVLDWHAMGDVGEWYARNKADIVLHTQTRVYVQWLLANLEGGT